MTNGASPTTTHFVAFLKLLYLATIEASGRETFWSSLPPNARLLISKSFGNSPDEGHRG